MSRPYDFHGLSYDAQRRIRQSEHDLRKARAQAHRNNNAAAEAESLRAANTELVEALRDLETAEYEYRKMHDLHGDGDMRTGRAWDLMRRKGDAARKALSLYGDER